MASWFNQLLKPLAGKSEPAVALGAFGKHPGWNDHLEDIGLETEALLAARQLLYVQGIGGLIDSAAWEKLGPGEALPEFGHVAIWFGESEVLAARLWASRDGKGRAKYPMVVCAHAAQLAPGLALRALLPELERAESACKAAATAEEVRAALVQSREALRQKLLGPAAGPPPLPVAPLFAFENPAWQRSLYAAESQLRPFVGKVSNGQSRLSIKMGELPVLAQQLRLPAAGEAKLAEATLFWRRVVETGLGVKAPLLFLQPRGEPWLDLIVGCPTPKQLLCLRATAKAIPPVETIPYTLPADFAEHAAAALQAAQT